MFERRKADRKRDSRGGREAKSLFIFLLLERVRVIVRVNGLIVDKKFIEGGFLLWMTN
jgi:hypothetical protein